MVWGLQFPGLRDPGCYYRSALDGAVRPLSVVLKPHSKASLPSEQKLPLLTAPT